MSASLEQIRLIKYALLQTTIGPSLVCDLVVFVYIIRHWRKEVVDAPQNHAVLCLLLASFAQKTMDLPMSLYVLRWGTVVSKTNAFCLAWGVADYSLLTVSLDLVTWCCIERHLFVFHSNFMRQHWCLVLFHYIPLVVCLLYTPLFYFCIIVFPSMCENVWDYTLLFCGGGCYGLVPFWGAFDWLFHYAFPIVILFVSNVALVYRFALQKIRRQQPVQWKRHRRMIVQLTFISSLYFILMSPEIVLGVTQALWAPTFGIDIQLNYFYFIANFINQLLPFVIVCFLPGVRRELHQYVARLRGGVFRGGRVQPFLPTTTQAHW